jgi:dienelactone hydrolase
VSRPLLLLRVPDHQTTPETRRIASLDQTVKLLIPILADLAGRGRGGRRIHLFGFSQGGTVALEVARQLTVPSSSNNNGSSSSSGSGSGSSGGPPAWLGSVVSISGALLEEQLPQLERGKKDKGEEAARAGPAKAGVPVLITHGDLDKVVSRALIERWVCRCWRGRLGFCCVPTAPPPPAAVDSPPLFNPMPTPQNNRSAALLRPACAVTIRSVAGKGHAMVGSSKEEAAALMQLWSKSLAARPPDDDAVEISPGEGPRLPTV